MLHRAISTFTLAGLSAVAAQTPQPCAAAKTFYQEAGTCCGENSVGPVDTYGTPQYLERTFELYYAATTPHDSSLAIGRITRQGRDMYAVTHTDTSAPRPCIVHAHGISVHPVSDVPVLDAAALAKQHGFNFYSIDAVTPYGQSGDFAAGRHSWDEAVDVPWVLQLMNHLKDDGTCSKIHMSSISNGGDNVVGPLMYHENNSVVDTFGIGVSHDKQAVDRTDFNVGDGQSVVFLNAGGDPVFNYTDMNSYIGNIAASKGCVETGATTLTAEETGYHCALKTTAYTCGSGDGIFVRRESQCLSEVGFFSLCPKDANGAPVFPIGYVGFDMYLSFLHFPMRPCPTETTGMVGLLTGGYKSDMLHVYVDTLKDAGRFA